MKEFLGLEDNKFRDAVESAVMPLILIQNDQESILNDNLTSKIESKIKNLKQLCDQRQAAVP